MKIHEYQAKEMFTRYGVKIPGGKVARTPQEASRATEELGGQAVLKSQVHAGGRGNAGGVKVVRSPSEAETVAGQLLGKNLVTRQTDAQGVPVNLLLVEELANIAHESYLAITVDSFYRGTVILASAKGGMDIEEVAAANPEDIHTESIDSSLGLMPFQTRRLAVKLGFGPELARPVGQAIGALYRLFIENDCSLVEINPLIATAEGEIVALDAKITLEDDSLFRHADLVELRDKTQEDALEAQAVDLDISYVTLDGDVGCLVNGAGLAMATLDAAQNAGASPANFLDVGGGATDEKVASAVEIILSDPKVKQVLVNIFGGILRCDIAARGIVLAYGNKNADLPLVVRMLGTNVDEGKAILRDSGLPVTFADTISEAAKAITAVK
ncbi:MAG: succinate--CoA ligase subunit beta [SAR202 cluster bacterium Io17-Chloro-G7]|nr:MAG: succinate--CoA ligase subunit beta [SAR202 cluster bacterium Io17-Chloro-G7]